MSHSSITFNILKFYFRISFKNKIIRKKRFRSVGTQYITHTYIYIYIYIYASVECIYIILLHFMYTYIYIYI